MLTSEEWDTHARMVQSMAHRAKRWGNASEASTLLSLAQKLHNLKVQPANQSIVKLSWTKRSES